jgi:hypothetical protein
LCSAADGAAVILVGIARPVGDKPTAPAQPCGTADPDAQEGAIDAPLHASEPFQPEAPRISALFGRSKACAIAAKARPVRPDPSFLLLEAMRRRGLEERDAAVSAERGRGIYVDYIDAGEELFSSDSVRPVDRTERPRPMATATRANVRGVVGGSSPTFATKARKQSKRSPMSATT